MYLLLQAATDAYQPLLALTEGIHREYAERHGMEYRRAGGPIMPQWHAYWTPVFLCLSLFEASPEIEAIFWLDADTLIVGHESIVIAMWNAGLAMCRHAGPPEHWNFGVVWMRNTRRVRDLLRWTIARGPGGYPWYNEQIVNDLLAADPFTGMCTLMDNRWNSTFGHTEVPDPVIVAWHSGSGPAHKLGQMTEYMRPR